MARSEWINAASRVTRGEFESIACPEDSTHELQVTWLPFDDSAGGEYRLRCKECVVENFVLVRETPTVLPEGGRSGVQ